MTVAPAATDLLEAVAGCTLFASLNREALRVLEPSLRVASLAAGAPLVRAGDPSEAVFIVLDGKVDVGGIRAGAGTALGELQAVTGSRHAVPIVASEPARIL